MQLNADKTTIMCFHFTLVLWILFLQFHIQFHMDFTWMWNWNGKKRIHKTRVKWKHIIDFFPEDSCVSDVFLGTILFRNVYHAYNHTRYWAAISTNFLLVTHGITHDAMPRGSFTKRPAFHTRYWAAIQYQISFWFVMTLILFTFTSSDPNHSLTLKRSDSTHHSIPRIQTRLIFSCHEGHSTPTSTFNNSGSTPSFIFMGSVSTVWIILNVVYKILNIEITIYHVGHSMYRIEYR